MKHIKIYENFKDIDSICKKYYITEYNINPDGSLNVFQLVDLANKSLTKIPLDFEYIDGYFYCGYNNLTTLEGCPRFVNGLIAFNSNKLTTLEGCPYYVAKNFYCYDNKLTTLEVCPKEMNGNFYFRNNNIKSLYGCPTKVKENIVFHNNQLPQEIYDNYQHIKKIIYWHSEYNVFPPDLSFNKENFLRMMDDIDELGLPD